MGRIALIYVYSPVTTPEHLNLGQAFAAAGHEAYVFTGNEAGGIDSAVCTAAGWKQLGSLPGSPALWIGSRRSWATAGRTIGARLRALRPDLTFVHVSKAAWSVPLFGPRETRYVLDVRQAGRSHDPGLRGTLSDVVTRIRLLVQRLFLFDGMSFLTREQQRWALGGHTVWLSHVVPLGVPAAFLTAPRHPSAMGWTDFIFSGTLATDRRLESVLQAAAIVRRSSDHFAVTMAGPDGSGGHYARLVRSMGLESVVCFTGALGTADLAARIQRAHVALAYIPLTRVYTHQPSLKALEYRALGIPMIGTATAHNRELIVEGVNGFVVDDSPEQLAAAMLKAMQPGWLARASEQAEAMRSGVTWDDVARRYLETFLPSMDAVPQSLPF